MNLFPDTNTTTMDTFKNLTPTATSMPSAAVATAAAAATNTAAAAAEKWVPSDLVANGIINVASVLFFVIVQTVFFMFVVSRELDRTVEKKGRILRVARDQLRAMPTPDPNIPTVAVLVLDSKLARMRPDEDQVRRIAELRRAYNWDLVLRWVGPVVLTLVGLLLALVVLLRVLRKPFTYAHRVGIALIAFVYVIEIMFFFFVVEKWHMVGDWELLRMAAGLEPPSPH